MPSSPTRSTTRIGRGGRLVIPAEARKQLHLQEGEKVMVEVHDGELRVYSVREAVRRAQEIVARHVPPGVSLVDELERERREEAARE